METERVISVEEWDTSRVIVQKRSEVVEEAEAAAEEAEAAVGGEGTIEQDGVPCLELQSVSTRGAAFRRSTYISFLVTVVYYSCGFWNS